MTPAQFNELQRQADVIEQHKKWKESKAIPELSDEEIEDEAKEYRKRLMQHYSNDETFADMISFEMGAKWYREQLKQRQ